MLMFTNFSKDTIVQKSSIEIGLLNVRVYRFTFTCDVRDVCSEIPTVLNVQQ